MKQLLLMFLMLFINSSSYIYSDTQKSFQYENLAENLLNENYEINEPENQNESHEIVVVARRIGTQLYFYLEDFFNWSFKKINLLKAYIALNFYKSNK